MAPGRRVALGAGAWLLAGTLLITCGGEEGGSSSDGELAGRDPAAEPNASDPEAVVPYLEDLLAEHDRLVAEVLADPSVAGDPDSPVIRRYAELFAPDSDLPDQVVEVWTDRATSGLTIEPYDDEHPVVETTIDGEVEVVDDDEVRVPTCEARRERTYEDGELRGGVPLREQAGATAAVRVEGRWLISTREVHAGAPCEGGAS